jgi:hypothetical protein
MFVAFLAKLSAYWLLPACLACCFRRRRQAETAGASQGVLPAGDAGGRDDGAVVSAVQRMGVWASARSAC